MKMTDDRDDKALDALFAAARTDDVNDDAFMARLMADADAGAAQHIPAPKTQTAAPRPAFWARWLPASGLTAATVAGFWIGMVLPGSEFSTAYLSEFGTAGTEVTEFMPSFGVGGLVEEDG